MYRHLRRQDLESDQMRHLARTFVNLHVFSAALICQSAFAEEAIQWTKADGGNGHWYALDPTDGISWTDARAVALESGGDLASMSSEAENLAIHDLLLAETNINASNQTYHSLMPVC